MSGKRKPPVACDERADPNPFWGEDPCDVVIPPPGLISDMVYYARGREVPTLFTIWTTLFALSSAIKREAWIPWADERLYTNYYTIIVGPAGVVKKNAALHQAMRVLQGIQGKIVDPQMRLRKHIEMLVGSFTPESLFESLGDAKKKRTAFPLKDAAGELLRDADGKPIMHQKTSELAIALYEMATTIGKQKYNEGMIEKLLDLYDPTDKYQWRTVKRGFVTFPYTHTTLCALTTAQGFRSSIPPVATSDGFLSRCVIVYQSDTPRSFPEPRVPDGAPSIGELRNRLAWIAEHTMGEYRLEDKARDRYYSWYHEFRKRIRFDVQYSGVRSRVPTLILKVALLIRAQRYDAPLGELTIFDEDLVAAQRLTERTWIESRSLIGFLTDGEASEGTSRVEEVIRIRRKVSRMSLLKNGHVKSDDVSVAVSQLLHEGRIRIRLHGVEQAAPSRNSEEIYEWVGEEETESEQAEGTALLGSREDPENIPSPAVHKKGRKRSQPVEG